MVLFSCDKNAFDKGSQLLPSTMGTVTVIGENNGGNITCDEVSMQTGCEFEFSSGRLNYEDYKNGGTTGPITWTTDGTYVNWSSTVPVKIAVIVKGGNGAAVYFSGCEDCLTEGKNLTAPINPNNGKPYGVSNVTFCYTVCEEETKCETAFARKTATYLAKCFLELDLDNDGTMDFNRWGWTNGPVGEGTTSYYNIYAGAAQCDVSKGVLVGRMDVKYYNGSVEVVIGMYNDYRMDETHLYIGNDILPKDNGEYTVAPGQYPYSHDLTSAKSDKYVINGVSGNIYVVLHAVVCGL